jgi:sugar/nucleoside kinase (ribokinase family)
MTAHEIPDYLAIGHITIDLGSGGTPVLGGTALYAALTAARFGLRAAILTRGNFAQLGPGVERARAGFAGEVNIVVQSASEPTVFTNVTLAGRRRQTVHSWAGEIDLNGLPPSWRSARIVHLAPIAQEIDPRQAGRLNPAYFGVTPQGWMRRWPSGGGDVKLTSLRLPFELLSRIDGLALSSVEQSLAREAIDAVARRGLVAITRGQQPTQMIDRGRLLEVPSYRVRVVDDTGAGDVFAAALFLLRAEPEPALAAGRMAAAAAALRIQAVGPDGVPDRAQVERFVRQHQEAGAGRGHSPA